MNTRRKISTIGMQKILVSVSVLLFLIKISAYMITGSIAILTDALESTVNVIAGFIGLYSIILSAKPKDENHPYGHGKAEFISAAFEGILISIAGLVIIYEAIDNFFHPHELKQLDSGLILVGITALINYIIGVICVRKGEREQSPILISSGHHLKSDTYSTLGLLLGIGLILITGYKWIDSITAFIFAFIIIFTGYKIIRKSISGMMDESDTVIMNQITEVLNQHRKDEWIDIHNVRVINYVGFYHIDCHLTVPYYRNVNEAHLIQDRLTDALKAHFYDRVEFFIHVDGCIPSFQCRICQMECSHRQESFKQQIIWNPSNLCSDQKHQII